MIVRIEDTPKWVYLDRLGLTGNVLITGSIGSGKTQGAILPFFEQLLSNFEVTPCVLAIDPKGTFIKKAVEIIGRLGMSDRMLHLKLGGDVKINPVYSAEGLKGSAILDLANMIRVASANAVNQSNSGNSDFWEQNANNLIKNGLTYCSAVFGYYTLNHLYRVILEGHTADFAGDLEKVMESKTLSTEESHNIRSAQRYFEQEYRNLEEKIRSSIVTTATCFLNQFQEFQASEIFCPDEDQISVRSMDDLVDSGKILLFDISSPALSRSMGTFIKLMYQRSLLNRLNNPKRSTERLGALIIDEYQDVVSSAGNGMLGDDGYFAKAREANTTSIVASQSLTSIENGVKKERVARELFQNFRTRIAFHSSDLSTIRSFQELIGQEDTKKVSHSISEYSQHTSRNLVAGTFESKDANISESVNTSDHKEYTVTAKEFARLKSFEAYAQVYDGIETSFLKICAKPYFLKEKRTAHKKLLQSIRNSAAAALICLTSTAHSFPNVCAALSTPEFRSCLKYEVSGCTCGYPPRPCAQISYYIPKTYIETFPDPKESFFKGLPAASAQMGALPLGLPFGAEADGDTQYFQAHVLSAPFVGIPFSLLSCGSSQMEKTCFEGMSEHVGPTWTSGTADQLQPNFLAWALNPKACLLKGAASSFAGEPGYSATPSSLMCSAPIAGLPRFPPSKHSACNGWGTFYPRTGVYQGGSQTIGALMVASRMRSISSEVMNASSSALDEQWQMIYPQSSSCFREGQNIGALETGKRVQEVGRITSGKLKGHLFAVWEKVSCCKDLSQPATDQAALGLFQGICQGL